MMHCGVHSYSTDTYGARAKPRSLLSTGNTVAKKTDAVPAFLELIREGGHLCLEVANSGVMKGSSIAKAMLEFLGIAR